MFPFYYPQQQGNSLTDLINNLKVLDEFIKGQQPKKDDKNKMVPAPEPWGPMDYFLWYTMANSIFATCLTIMILHFSK